MSGYRVKRIRVSLQTFVNIATKGVSTRCLEGVPEGALALNYCPASDGQIEVLVTHPTFEEVPGDTLVPYIADPIFTRIS